MRYGCTGRAVRHFLLRHQPEGDGVSVSAGPPGAQSDSDPDRRLLRHEDARLRPGVPFRDLSPAARWVNVGHCDETLSVVKDSAFIV